MNNSQLYIFRQIRKVSVKTAALTDNAIFLVEHGSAVRMSEVVCVVVWAGKGQRNAVGARLWNGGPLSSSLGVCLRGLRRAVHPRGCQGILVVVTSDLNKINRDLNLKKQLKAHHSL